MDRAGTNPRPVREAPGYLLRAVLRGALAALGVPAFACTPDAFPELLAAAINGRDLTGWAGQQGFVTR